MLPANLTAPTKDRSFIRCGSLQIKEVVEKVVTNALKKGYTARDIQVLAPMYRGKAGINELNVLLQGILNPPKENGAKLNSAMLFIEPAIKFYSL